MDHNMSVATIRLSKKGGGNERMHLHRRPFWWPHGRIEAIWSTSPDAAWPGLHWKPLDAAIGRQLAPYHPKCTHFVGRFNGHHNAVVRYCAHCRWRRFVAFIKATTCHNWVSTRSNNINSTRQGQLFLLFYHEKGLELTCWPLITIGVWHISNWWEALNLFAIILCWGG